MFAFDLLCKPQFVCLGTPFIPSFSSTYVSTSFSLLIFCSHCVLAVVMTLDRLCSAPKGHLAFNCRIVNRVCAEILTYCWVCIMVFLWIVNLKKMPWAMDNN